MKPRHVWDDYATQRGIHGKRRNRYIRIARIVAVMMENEEEIFKLKPARRATKIYELITENGIDINKRTLFGYFKLIGFKSKQTKITTKHLDKLAKLKPTKFEYIEKNIKQNINNLECGYCCFDDSDNC